MEGEKPQTGAGLAQRGRNSTHGLGHVRLVRVPRPAGPCGRPDFAAEVRGPMSTVHTCPNKVGHHMPALTRALPPIGKVAAHMPGRIATCGNRWDSC